MQTRWVDEGHEAPTPRELWIEARGPAPSLDHAASKFGAIGRYLSTLLSFTANVEVGMPEVHIAYDASSGQEEREFLEVFLPDERGHLKEGRIAKTDELVCTFEGLRDAEDGSRINRAIQQYCLALRYWYFGGEWLALSHLYMAVETLTRPALRRYCRDENAIDEQELAARQGIDTSDKSKWRHEIEAWCRKQVIFEEDNDTYRAARRASDGVEHGFLEMDEVFRHALVATEATFGYVRKTILRLLNLVGDEFAEMHNRIPRDVRSLRKMAKGHFTGDGSDPAPAGEVYPRLEWLSTVKTLKRDDDRFTVSFEERFTVRCSPSYGFRGQTIEVRGRAEPGQVSINLGPVTEVSSQPDPGVPTSPLDALTLMGRARGFALTVSDSSKTVGIPGSMVNVFGLFSVLLSLFEAIQLLIKNNRPVEGMVLLRSLILGTSRLQSIVENDNREGVALRVKIDALKRFAHLLGASGDITNKAPDEAQYLANAKQNGIIVPAEPPDIRSTEFYTKNQNSLLFVEEIALADLAAVSLHSVRDKDGNLSMSTQVVDERSCSGLAADAIDAMVTAAVGLARGLSWPHDEVLAAEIQAEALRLVHGERAEVVD